MLYRRDHSVLELKNKLTQWYTDEAVRDAIQRAQDREYIKEPEFLSKQFGEALHRKEKGIYYINNALKKKGLPPLPTDPDRELSKCRELLQKKYGDQENLTTPLRVKAFRYLTSRGFDSETINKAIHNKF